MELLQGIFLLAIIVPFSTPIRPNLVTYEGENRQLTSIPDDIPTNVEHLKLFGNRITEIPANAFSNFEELYVLDLSSNQISNIELRAFKGLTRLRYLYLQSNRISSLKPGVFSDIEEIKVLLLGDNQMTSIILAQTSGLLDLTELGLENNRISTLDADTIWDGLPPYRIKLHLEGNPFACNESLCWLDMEYQKLNVVWNNPPTCASGENWFDAQICPENSHYRGTRRGLTEVPDDIPHNVEEVFLNVNNITEIKANAFSNLASCTDLHLLKNRISKIESGAFKGLNNLQYLNLKDNIISEIEAGAFEGLNNLKSLDLSSNSLESLGPEVLDDLPRPFKLNLRDNTFQCNKSMICPLRKEDDDETIEFIAYPLCPNGFTLHYNTNDCDASRANEARGFTLLGFLTVFVALSLA